MGPNRKAKRPAPVATEVPMMMPSDEAELLEIG
jgi:hypothetical protein